MQYTIQSSGICVRVTEKGAMLTSLQKNGVEYLWQGDPAFWAGQAPVCFPICGTLIGGRAVAFGKPCAMRRHGVAHFAVHARKTRCKRGLVRTGVRRWNARHVSF